MRAGGAACSCRPALLLLQQAQRRAGALRLNRRCVCALSAAGLLLAALLLLAAAWPRPEDAAADAALAWLRRSRDARRYVRPLTSTALLAPPPVAACGAGPAGLDPALALDPAAGSDLPAGSAPAPRLLLLVTSAPGHAEQRQAIRDTWGRRSAEARLVFFLGRGPEPPPPDRPAAPAELAAEAERHGDLVVEDFVDTYQNLTLKTLFMLKWALRDCPAAPFVLKTDDDMLINTRGLVRALPRWLAAEAGPGRVPPPAPLPPDPAIAADYDYGPDPGVAAAVPLLLGFRYHRVLPYRDAASKWYLPRWLFADDVLPDFVSGTAYLMSRAALERLYSAALDTPLLPLEDVFLTGVVAGERLGLARVHVARFSAAQGALPVPGVLEHPCLYHHLLTAHRFEPERLRRTWHALVHLQPGRACSSLLMRLLGRVFAPGHFQFLLVSVSNPGDLKIVRYKGTVQVRGNAGGTGRSVQLQSSPSLRPTVTTDDPW